MTERAAARSDAGEVQSARDGPRGVRKRRRDAPLNAYLDELEWRFSYRENARLFRNTVRKLIDAEKLEYRKLRA